MRVFRNFALPWVIATCFISTPSLATESNASIDLKKIAEETSELNEKKLLVEQNYQTEAKACWKNFAVNDCLAKARRNKYQQLAPLEPLEIALNAKRRAIKEADRLERLIDKSKSEMQPLSSPKAEP